MSIFPIDCQRILVAMENCEFSFPENKRYFPALNYETSIPKERFDHVKAKPAYQELLPGKEAYAYSGNSDFSHTNPDWEEIEKLGLPGLKKRIEFFKSQNPDRQAFYDALLEIYDAIFAFIKRAAKEAECAGKHEMAQNLLAQLNHAPETLYQAIQLNMICYVLQMNFDGSLVRALGRIDSMMEPYKNDLSKEEICSLYRDWFLEMESFKVAANIPFAIGGTDLSGNEQTNDFSMLILNVFGELVVPHVKAHLLISKKTPDAFIRRAMELIRENRNSIVFMSDETVINSLIRLGEPIEDARHYAIVGCYEAGGYQEITSTCNGIVNLAKAVEYTMTGGFDLFTNTQICTISDTKDYSNFADFMNQYLQYVKEFCACSIQMTDLFEEDYDLIHGSPIFSSFYSSALEKGKDIYSEYGAKYNNSSINGIALGTAVDALVSIKKLVYEEKKLSLSDFVQILKDDWANNEVLRLYARNRLPKFGQGNPEADSIARQIMDTLYESVNGVPNKKGGIYRLGTFSIDWRWEWGEHTAASADGRRRGETLSQNTAATFGQAKQGATAHLSSVASLGLDRTPNGSIVDVDFHSSAVSGENGLNAMVSSVKTYFGQGGFAVHYNVLNGDVLRAAKKDPAKYPDLQVRLCGWNVLFNSLSEKEKDDFIFRSEE